MSNLKEDFLSNLESLFPSKLDWKIYRGRLNNPSFTNKIRKKPYSDSPGSMSWAGYNLDETNKGIKRRFKIISFIIPYNDATSKISINLHRTLISEGDDENFKSLDQYDLFVKLCNCYLEKINMSVSQFDNPPTEKRYDDLKHFIIKCVNSYLPFI